MIMPYGTKDTQAPAGKGPSKVDFDALWRLAFAPVIDRLGYEAIRADQDLGALIIQEMLERLALADLVLADMTIPNANVYYEVGVRHAARSTGCVLLGADWSRPLFDVDQMRRVQYPLPAAELTAEMATAIQSRLEAAIPGLANGISPVFQSLPGFPDQVDPARMTSFVAFARALSEFQASILAVRGARVADRKARALKLRDDHKRLPAVSPAVALELLGLLRDCTDWQTTLEYIDGLPASVRELALVREQRALGQAKVGDPQAAIAALETLIDSAGDSSERQGMIGGRYKQLYTAATDANERARYLDLAIEHYERGMSLNLNDYYPSSNLPRLYRARGAPGDGERAVAALHVARIACERARQRNPKDPWARHVMLGAAFDAEDVPAAEALYTELRKEGPAAWKLGTTISDLELSLGFVEDATRRTALQNVLARLGDLARPRG